MNPGAGETNDELHSRESELCENCGKILIHEIFSSEFRPDHLTDVFYQIPANNDCEFCTLAVSALGVGSNNGLNATQLKNVYYRISLAPFSIWKVGGPVRRIKLLEEDADFSKPLLCLWSSLRRDFVARRIGHKQIDFNLVRQWLEACENNTEHSKCGWHVLDPIDIILIDVEEKRLVERRSDVRYLALSYVWGRAGGLETTRDNYSLLQRKGSIPLDHNEIPQTIRDSMVLVQRLQERYLWVDRLCIIQDDPSKLAMIQRMGEIYSHALMTIIALGEDANQGLPGVLPGSRQPQDIILVQGLHLTPELPTHPSALTLSVHSTRGWTFQEVLLSRRRLFVSDHQVYFHCSNDSLRREDSPHEIKFRSTDLFVGPKYVMLDSDSYDELVKNFTNRELAHDGDILDAFAGVKTYLGYQSPEKDVNLVAGLPIHNLIRNLSWFPRRIPVRRSPRAYGQIEEHFPSWSWAGWKGPVSYMPEEFQVVPLVSLELIPDTTSGESIVFESKKDHAADCPIGLWSKPIPDGQRDLSTSFKQHLQVIPTAKRIIKQSLLQFWAPTFPTKNFSLCQSLPYRSIFQVFLRHTSKHLCGAIIGEKPSNFDLLWPNCKFTLLCSNGSYAWTNNRVLKARFGTPYQEAHHCCTLPVCLIFHPSGEFWERVGVAIIDPAAFDIQDLEWMYIRLV